MLVRSLNRGFSEDKQLSSVSLVFMVRLADGTVIDHNVIRRPLSNVGYGHSILKDGRFEQATPEEIRKYLTNAFDELSVYKDEDVKYFKLQWSALDTSHGRLTRYIESSDNPSFTEALDNYRKGTKIVLTWSKLQ